MAVPRKDPFLNEALDILDAHLRRCKLDYAEAFNTLTSDEEKFINEEIARCALDPIYYLENYYVVKSKLHGIKTLYPLWDSQLVFWNELEELRQAGLPQKVIVLKARQLGLSTMSEGLIFQRTVFNDATNALIVAQDPGQADYLFSMFTNAYEYLPWWMRPEVRYRSKGRYMVFDSEDPMRQGLKSEIFVEAANKITGVSVGKAINVGHLSELSDWDNAKTLTEQIFPTMTNNSTTLVILESTARGRTGFWYKYWVNSVNKWGDGSWMWKPIFIEWFRCADQYSKTISIPGSFKISEEERSFREKALRDTNFFIPDEMFNWRRSKIDETRSITGDEWSFYQEYPANWMEAFQASGVCAFSKRKLHQIMEIDCREPKYVGEIIYRPGNQQEIIFQSVEDNAGLYRVEAGFDIPGTEQIGYRLQVWEKPLPGEKYYVSADPAEGIEGGNASCTEVFKVSTDGSPDEQVAEWHGWAHPTPFGYIVVALAKWYNEAEVSCELNNGCGEATYICIAQTLEYPNLFRWKHYDKIKNPYTNYMGWLTNSKTRDLIITRMGEKIMDNTVLLRSAALVDEMMNFAREEGDTRFEGQNTGDDRVMAAMINVWCAHDMDFGLKKGNRQQAPGVGCKYYLLDEQGRTVAECQERGQALGWAASRAGRSFRREMLAIDFSNTEYSPVHDRSGPRARLFAEGMPAEQISAAGLYAADEPNDGDWKQW